MADLLERVEDLEGRRMVLRSGRRHGVYAVVTGADGRLRETNPVAQSPTGEATTLGLVDIQVNGFAGVDFNRADLSAEDMDRALAAMLACGATRCLPTVITASLDAMKARLRSLDAAVAASRLGPWMVMGYHVEGPFLSSADGYAGCHPKAHMRSAGVEALAKLQDGLRRPVRVLTMAPEREGVLDLIPHATAQGIVVSIGHTGASLAEVEAAVAAGARLSTHLGNGLLHLLEKNANPLFAQLGQDHLSASFIADGVHIPPYMFRIYARAKELSRTILITDATAGAAAEPGLYTLGDVQVERQADGIMREPGSPYLGGSSATMEEVTRNAMNWLGIALDDALDLGRTNALLLLGEAAVPRAGAALEYVRWRDGATGPKVVEAGVGPWRIIRE